MGVLRDRGPQAGVPPAAALAAGLFLFSGASSLVYEIAWTRMLVVSFGVSAAAVSTVLAAFMGGLALGSWTLGRVADRVARPLRLYAWLELGVGIYALAVPFLVGRLQTVYVAAYHALDGLPGVFPLVRFAIGFGLLLVPTTFMGATLPVMSRWVVRTPEAVGRGVGRLYAWNTAGAVLGSVLTAFVLLERFGVVGTTLIAAGVNLLVAATAWLVDRRMGSPVAETAPKRAAAETVEAAVAPARPSAAREASESGERFVRAAVFWGFGLSGFAALGYEVVWSRLLSIVLNLTTTQSLSVILVAFLTGLAGGGAIGSRLADRRRDPASTFGLVQLLLGLLGVASIAALTVVPAIARGLGFLPEWSGHLLRLGAATLAVTLLPTLLMGLAFPLAVRVHAAGADVLGRRVGGLYAVNTCGALLGAFAGGFVLVPALGSHGALLLLAGINTAVGALVLAADRVVASKRRLALAATLGLATLVLAVSMPLTLVPRLIAPPGTELLHYDERAGGTVTVLRYPDGKRLLKVNGAGEVPTDTDSIRTFRLLGNLPMLLHPAAEQVLVVAFGGGVTLDAVSRHRPDRIDCVEVVPAVVDAAAWLDTWNHGIGSRLEEARIHLVPDDGRNHLLRTDRRYDVIIADATHPGTADSWLLYTADFYRLCRDRLRPGGMLAQWVPLHGLTGDDYRMLLRTFRRVFPHATLWITPGYSVLLGTPEGLRIDLAELRARLDRPELRADLGEVDLDDAVSMISALALDERAMAVFAGDGPINTDDRPHIGLGDRARAGTGSGLPAILAVLPHLVPDPGIAVTAASPADRERLRRRFLSRRHVLAADAALKLGDAQRAMTEARAALEADPANRTAMEQLRVATGRPER